MVTFREIMADLQSLDGWRRELFATGCAQRIQPLVNACGSPKSAALYDRGLRMAWDGTTGDERTRLVADLWSAPEMEAESSAEREYYAMIPIHLLAAVLEGEEDGTDIGGMGSAQALNALPDVDLTLLPPDERPRIINPGNPPPPGRLESEEAEAQSRSITLLRSATSREQAMADLRPEAERQAADLAAVMPTFLEMGEY